jgi:hypothetical protein
MQRAKALIYKACADAILYFHAKGRNTEHQLDNIKRARALLHSNIVQLATKDENVFPRMLHALEEAYEFDLKPEPRKKEKEYCVDMMIRDSADICRTLKRLTEGKERSDSNKIVIARTFCLAMYRLLK